MQSQGLKFDEGYVFNTDFQQNYRRGDNLYDNFNNLRLDGKTAEEMDTTIQGIIDNANRLTTDPAAIRQHNEEVERQVVAKTSEVIEGDQDYGFGESLKNKKELTLSEMLDEVED